MSTEQVNANCEVERPTQGRNSNWFGQIMRPFVTAIMVKNEIILQKAQDNEELHSAIESKLMPKARENLKER